MTDGTRSGCPVAVRVPVPAPSHRSGRVGFELADRDQDRHAHGQARHHRELAAGTAVSPLQVVGHEERQLGSRTQFVFPIDPLGASRPCEGSGRVRRRPHGPARARVVPTLPTPACPCGNRGRWRALRPAAVVDPAGPGVDAGESVVQVAAALSGSHPQPGASPPTGVGAIRSPSRQDDAAIGPTTGPSPTASAAIARAARRSLAITVTSARTVENTASGPATSSPISASRSSS